MFFEFESDFADSWHCIPMIVRYKLDSCGVKLKLSHWHQFSREQREYLINAPSTTPEEILAYKDKLQNWIISIIGVPASEFEVNDQPEWLNIKEIPDKLTDELEKQGYNQTISLENWQKLTYLQRFALLKLSQSKHENRNLLPALQEFGLL